ncbi:MFS transporter [Actinokineospora auranticolor]|uniref:Putative MFS family arabinose efflux permease n=1 Tax=Actinokineospora auranticolor TaxID=155976 RepID=A0A2S6H1V5_9PSEU|nr:MFS transporter [Actinokineospora auranticolor]PPK71465.1 putative MFS family arabinose efflux permease [Actinokineospora auranticolor]
MRGDGIGRFLAIGAGQLVSVAGTGITGFVLGVWVFQVTGSATRFGLIMLLEAVAAIAVAPLAGMAADRVDRRAILLVSDVVAAAATAVLLTLVRQGELDVWHVYPIAAITAMCATFRVVAFTTVLPLLVPERHLGRANGLAQAQPAVQIAAPLAAGGLLAVVHLSGVVLIDLCTYAVALAITLLVGLPEKAVVPSRAGAPGEGALAELTGGLRELRRRPGLPHLLLLLGAFHLAAGMAGVLVQPLILTFTDPSTLGVLMFAGGAGMIAGSAVMTAWGGPDRRITGVRAFLAIAGIALALHSLAPSALLIGVLAPAFLFTLPIITGSAMSLLQTKVDPSALGRAMASARIAAQGGTAIGFAAAGPLADLVFGPMLQPDGALADTVGAVIGVGDGRGIALIFAGTGAALVALAAWATASPALRAVDDLPDLLTTDKREADARPTPG